MKNLLLAFNFPKKVKLSDFHDFLSVFGASESRLFWTFFRGEYGPNRHFTPFVGNTFSLNAKIEKIILPDSISPSFPKKSWNLEHFCTFLGFVAPKPDETQGCRGEVKYTILGCFLAADRIFWGDQIFENFWNFFFQIKNKIFSKVFVEAYSNFVVAN